MLCVNTVTLKNISILINNRWYCWCFKLFLWYSFEYECRRRKSG